MKRAPVSESSLPKLPPDQLEKLTTLLGRHARQVMPHEIAVTLGSTRVVAKAIMIGLASAGAAKLFLLVYHCEDVPIASRPWTKGLPRVPWRCPKCGQPVSKSSELTYDMLCDVKRPIELVDG